MSCGNPVNGVMTCSSADCYILFTFKVGGVPTFPVPVGTPWTLQTFLAHLDGSEMTYGYYLQWTVKDSYGNVKATGFNSPTASYHDPLAMPVIAPGDTLTLSINGWVTGYTQPFTTMTMTLNALPHICTPGAGEWDFCGTAGERTVFRTCNQAGTGYDCVQTVNNVVVGTLCACPPDLRVATHFTGITVSKRVITYGEDDVIYGYLMDSSNNPIIGRTVSIQERANVFNGVTDSNGYFVIPFSDSTPADGYGYGYDLAPSFGGDTSYLPTTASIIVTITPSPAPLCEPGTLMVGSEYTCKDGTVIYTQRCNAAGNGYVPSGISCPMDVGTVAIIGVAVAAAAVGAFLLLGKKRL